ncbi:hypothetical protein SAMN06272722_11090 [Paenibacillus sp. RU5A]|nr:hypothetical protein SAMN06272722_11090 [Paenibacillus sp. RU5A]SOC74236.1 hypothetical protein SAMN05880581_11090 [Paenibacillus sp. RU26A]SOC76386.1 hypothetical protein SAMN05880586_11090 [Paenibacillus sp. RU5M]
MRIVNVGINCNERQKNSDCDCERYDFPYGSIHRIVCEIVQVRLTEEDEYISWLEVLSQYPSLGLTRDEFIEKYGCKSYFAEDDLHSFRN